MDAVTRGERALEYEVAVIGSMLLDDRCIGPLLPEVAEDDFCHAPYRRLFTAMRDMFLAGQPVDPVTVAGFLRDDSQQLRDLMLQCMKMTPTAANAVEYAQLLRDESRRLRRQDLGYQLSQEADPEKQRALVSRLQALDADRRIMVVTAAESAQDFLERMRARKKPEFLPWGLPGLDRLLEVELGDDVVLGGYSSSGKTLLSMQFAVEQAKKYRVGYYSLETSTRKLVDRAMAGLSGVPLRAIKNMDYTHAQLWQMTESANRYGGLQLELIDGTWIHSAEDIIATALARRHQIIYIDYLQILVPPDSYKLYNAVTALSRTLHRAAQTHGITVVLLSQLTRPEKVKGQGATPPTMNSFKESGQIENDADVAMLLYPADPNDYRSPRVLKVAKNKDGPRDQLILDFEGAMMRMTELPEDKSREIAAQLSAKGKAAKKAARARPAEQFEELSGDDPDMPF